VKTILFLPWDFRLEWKQGWKRPKGAVSGIRIRKGPRGTSGNNRQIYIRLSSRTAARPGSQRRVSCRRAV